MKIKSSAKRAYSYNFYRDGVTQTCISLFLQCREQFRLQYVEGWSSQSPSMPLDFGSASHWCLQQIYQNPDKWGDVASRLVCEEDDADELDFLIDDYAALWEKEHKIVSEAEVDQQQRIRGFLHPVLTAYLFRVHKAHDPIYDDFRNKQWIHLETNFKIPWEFEDFTRTFLRGRWDGVFRSRKSGSLLLFETKNLSLIDEDGIAATLPMNLQVMLYLWALRQQFPNEKIGGVTYNILRRPGLRQGKEEPLDAFLSRVSKDVLDPKRADHYFLRFQCDMTHKEIDRWADQTLRPILTLMRQWWDEGVADYPKGHPSRGMEGAHLENSYHYMNPNALITKYGHCAMYDAIVRGDFSGLYKRSTPFNELEET